MKLISFFQIIVMLTRLMDHKAFWLMLSLPLLEWVEMHILMMMSFSLSAHQEVSFAKCNK